MISINLDHMNIDVQKEMEKTWDTIAESFDRTRKKPWAQCIDFINKLAPSSTIADLGCGNGRHTISCVKQCKQVIALDISKNLLSIVKEKTGNINNNLELIHANLINIPLKNESLDAAIYIASLHNIPYKEKRQKSLMELYRIIKNDGVALVTVWSKWQDKFQNSSKNYLNNKYNYEKNDIAIYWKQDKLNVPRFYHLYDKDEFQKEIESVGFKILKITEESISIKEKPDNYFAYLKK